MWVFFLVLASGAGLLLGKYTGMAISKVWKGFDDLVAAPLSTAVSTDTAGIKHYTGINWIRVVIFAVLAMIGILIVKFVGKTLKVKLINRHLKV